MAMEFTTEEQEGMESIFDNGDTSEQSETEEGTTDENQTPETEQKTDDTADKAAESANQKDDGMVEIETVNGVEKVSIDELKKGYMRQSDYTKKTQEISAQRKEFDEVQNNFITLLKNNPETSELFNTTQKGSTSEQQVAKEELQHQIDENPALKQYQNKLQKLEEEMQMYSNYMKKQEQELQKQQYDNYVSEKVSELKAFRPETTNEEIQNIKALSQNLNNPDLEQTFMIWLGYKHLQDIQAGKEQIKQNKQNATAEGQSKQTPQGKPNFGKMSWEELGEKALQNF